ncbi:hypothetical protein QFZ77_006903 [Paenibacillus sp. V4I3]|nr:hypothetical protein [Paenibacillus sp. V4I3]
MGKHIIGVFNSEEEAIRVINQLKAEGYRADDISVIGRNNEDLNQIEDETETKAEEGLATGAAAGGVLGGVTGLLLGIGALAIPGIGPHHSSWPYSRDFDRRSCWHGCRRPCRRLNRLRYSRERGQRL